MSVSQVRYDSKTALIPTEVIVKMPSAAPADSKLPPVFMVHPIEGVVSALMPLAKLIKRPVYGLQCTEQAPLTSVPDLASFYLKHMKSKQAKGPYTLVGYSFGACVAFEIALQLEKMGEKVDLTLLDGSHSYVALHTGAYRATHTDLSPEADALTYFVNLFRETDYAKVSISTSGFNDGRLFNGASYHFQYLFSRQGKSSVLSPTGRQG